MTSPLIKDTYRLRQVSNGDQTSETWVFETRLWSDHLSLEMRVNSDTVSDGFHIRDASCLDAPLIWFSHYRRVMFAQVSDIYALSTGMSYPQKNQYHRQEWLTTSLICHQWYILLTRFLCVLFWHCDLWGLSCSYANPRMFSMEQ